MVTRRDCPMPMIVSRWPFPCSVTPVRGAWLNQGSSRGVCSRPTAYDVELVYWHSQFRRRYLETTYVKYRKQTTMQDNTTCSRLWNETNKAKRLGCQSRSKRSQELMMIRMMMMKMTMMMMMMKDVPLEFPKCFYSVLTGRNTWVS